VLLVAAVARQGFSLECRRTVVDQPVVAAHRWELVRESDAVVAPLRHELDVV
jgi:hypothetical protein